VEYCPKPIDTSRVALRAELGELVEKLASNNHELWAQRRLAEGWTWGPKRDDAARRTPCLIPYDELPESEKEYDRVMAREALKCVAALGGSIVVPTAADAPAQASLADFRARVGRANGEGECLTACDIADEGLRYYPGDARLLQGRALALARMGSHEEARRILRELAEGSDDEETLGLLARTYKDLWLESSDPADLERAFQAYSDAYGRHRDRYWTGINAATLAAARGDREAAQRIGAEVWEVCLDRIASAPASERYWLAGTIAEAALVLGEYDEAERCYAEASRLAESDLGSLSSTLRNARIVLRTAPAETAARIERAIGMPRVAVFSGHMPDAPDRPAPRFPAQSTAAVGEGLRELLARRQVRIGYASAAAGADILFLEALQDTGGRTHVVLPSARDQFFEESVAGRGEGWPERFERVMARASEVIVASEERLSIGSIAYEYANQVLHGLAADRARQLGVSLARVAVWDGGPPERSAGTADAVGHWRAAGYDVDVIDPRDGRVWMAAADAAAEVFHGARDADPATAIRAMIFADAYHFSKLGESQMPGFVDWFLGPVAEMMERTSPTPVFRNTWGDGLFFVFEKAADAGRFAIGLAECVGAIDRRAAGLPESMHLRVALHVGPVYPFRDRIIGKPNYIGSHVNRTARIEPVTPPGQVYGTYAFAALAALQAPGEFRCDYVGRIPLAKSFGEFPMYRVRRG
jgi:tetratricopeptide (TPR) repeat protein